MDMPPGGTFEIGTQIISLQIDGFLRGWILNITPLNALEHLQMLAVILDILVLHRMYQVLHTCYVNIPEFSCFLQTFIQDVKILNPM